MLAYFFFQHGGISLGDPSNPAFLQNLFDYAYIPCELTEPEAACDVPQGEPAAGRG